MNQRSESQQEAPGQPGPRRPRAGAPVALAFVLWAATGCNGWPGVDGNADASTSNGPSAVIGTCTGTPLPCGALSGADCSSNSGCMDLGSCSGTPAVIGDACGTKLSYQACSAVSGCVWSPSCTGTPIGSCSGVTEESCLLAKGCAFIPANQGTGGASSNSNCRTYVAKCSSNASCDCGYSCVKQCATCAAICGNPCQTDYDCVGTLGGSGQSTPYCTGLTNPPTLQYPGLCSDTR